MARESGHPDFNPTLALLALFPSQFPHLSIKLLAWIGGFTRGFLGLWELQDYPGDTDAVESGGLGIGPHSALFSVLHIEPLCKLFLEEKVSWSKLKKNHWISWYFSYFLILKFHGSYKRYKEVTAKSHPA